MKKLAAIFLLLLLSFNFMGYRLWFYFVQQQADERLLSSLDAEQYNEADLITLTIPLQIPYQPSQKDFERVDGEIKVDGIIYKYVKRKVEGGQLVLLCLPDKQKMHLEDAKHTAFKLTNDVPATGKTDAAKTNLLKSIFSDYDRSTMGWDITPPEKVFHFNRPINDKISFTSYLTTPEQPPEGLA